MIWKAKIEYTCYPTFTYLICVFGRDSSKGHISSSKRSTDSSSFKASAISTREQQSI